MDVYSFASGNGAANKLGKNYSLTAPQTVSTPLASKDSAGIPSAESYNNGGFLGGLGYMGEKLAVGYVSSVEGMWDYALGGLAKLFGANDWAEQIFENDWFGDWYSHPEEWYNPSDGWRTAGDVTGGIGNSLLPILASIAATGIAVGTAGAGAPISAGILSAVGGAGATTAAGLGAAGTATRQAYRESGQLTGKEFAYGALSGATEGALEGVTTALSMGTGQIVKSVAGSFAKETAKTVAKQSVVKTLTEGFIGEAFEEGMSEIIDPVWQRLTYNPNAKNATPQEVAYAAFVGGMSGMLMSGGNVAVDSGNSFLKGNSLVGRGLDTEVVGLSQQLAAFETANNTGDETFQNIAQTYADLARSLETTGGKVTTVTQKKLLGDLQRANTVAVFKPMIAKSAANIVNNAEVIAERLNAYGYKTADGKPLTFTADQLRAGVDVNDPSSFLKALKTNSILRELAVADTTGHLVMDTERFAQATLMGKRLASQVDLNRFIETATPSEIYAVSQALGIENWSTLDVDTFNQKITDFVENGGVQQYADRRAMIQSVQAIPAETARPMPKMVNLRQDGSVRYSDGSTQIAITRQGDAYTVYDYASGHLSKNMTRSEVNKLLRDYNTRQADITAGARAQIEAESEMRRQAEELDTYARENIADYSKLSSPNQSMIRKVIREGRANGMSDEDVLAYAKISAHAGVDISFDKQATFRGHDEEGNEKYADGFYDPKTNRIVVNPDAKRSHERLLLHELEHTILKGKDGKKMIATAFKNMDEAMRNKIIDRYGNFYAGKGLDAAEKIDIYNDEISAHFAEDILSNRHTLEKLVEAEPTLKDKILSFFKGASEDYKSVPKLSKAARSYYKTYKKLFDEFAERNFQSNATEATNKKTAMRTNDENVQVTGDKNKKTPDGAGTDVDTDTRFALSKGKAERLKNDLVKLGTLGIRLDAGGKSIRILTDKFTQNKNIFSNKGRNMREVNARIKAIPHFAEILRSCTYEGSDTEIHGLENEAKKGVVAMHRFKGSYDGFDIEVVVRDKGSKQFLYEIKFIEKEKSPQQSMTDESASPAPLGDAENKPIITHSEKKSNTPGENSSKNFSGKRFALPETDSEGSSLSSEQREFFADTKVLDENGNLMPVYHGTMSGAFTVFDASKASVEGDMGAGFYFSSSYEDVNSNYEEGGQDLDNKIERLADRIEAEEDISHEEAYEKAHKILIKGTHLFEVYLNVKNPAYVGGTLDAATMLFGDDFYESELDINDFADEDEYYEAQYEERDVAVGELIERVASILDDEGISGYEGWSDLVFEENGFEEGMTIPQLHELIGKNMYDVMNEDGDLASHEVVRAIIEALGYDGIIDNSVVEKWGYKSGRYSTMEGLDENTRHYIVFRPEQIKLTSNKNPTADPDVRFALPETVEQEVLEKYGRTFSWSTTGYIFKNGTKLDLSGKSVGAPGGYRALDHRDIFDIYEVDSYTDAMIEFMARGNIRVAPESPGINLIVEPTEAQYEQITSLVERLGWKEKEFHVDFDNENGSTIGSLDYDGNVSARKVIADIKYFFKEGKIPYQSDLTQFRFALPENDSTGAELTSDQRKYFDASKQLDSEGRLQVMYQGAPEEFFTFDKKKSKASNLYGRGFYFTNSADQARHYGTVRGYYLNITNPLSAKKKTISRMQMRKFLNAVAENEDYSIENYGTYDVAEVMRSVYEGKSDFAMLYDVSLTAIGDLVEAVELFNKVNGTEYDGFILDTESVIFRSEQAKLTSNTAPSSNPDTRYALDADSEGTQLTEAQQEFFKNSKVRDSEGRLLVVYHGTEKGGFTVFAESHSGEAFWFADKATAISYIDKYAMGEEHWSGKGVTSLYSVYLNAENPLIVDAEGYRATSIPTDIFPSDGGKRRFHHIDDIALYAKDNGYDGLIVHNVKDYGLYTEESLGIAEEDSLPAGNVYAIFNSRQVKLTTNNSPTSNPDIRYALPDDDMDALFDDDADTSNSTQDETFDPKAIVARGMPRTAGKSSLTVGELRKIIANNTKRKVYSKQDALSVVGRFAGISYLTQKTRTEIADAVWQILNESPDVEYRRDVAHDMAEFVVAKIIVDAKTENPDVQEAQERLSYLRTGIGKLSFSEEDMSEIRHARGERGLKQILVRWGYKGTHKVAGASGVASGKRTPMDVFSVDIAREMAGMEYLEEMHPVDAFLEIDSLYERALAESKDKWISAYWDMPDSEIPGMIKSIEDEIMRAYETEGEQSKFSRMVENKVGYYSERAEYWKAEYDKIKGRDRLLGLLMSKAQKMKDLKLGTFANSTQHDSEIFKNSIEQLARIQFRGNLNVSGTRKILADLRQWYTSDAVKTGILEYVDGNSTGLYVQGVADMLETLSEGKGGFTKDDLKMLYDVMSYFTNFVENWGKVFRQGKWIEAKPEAERYINTLHSNESLKVGLFGKLAGTTYMQTFGDPMTVARRMDRYESGFYTEMMQELRDAAVDAQVAEMEIRTAYDEFNKKHKKYVEKASVDTVTYRNTEIPKMHLIGLYMTMKRKHAWAGLMANGFAFTDTGGKRIRVNGVVSPEAKITNAELEQYAGNQLSEIESLLTDTDKEYIAILEQAFNVDARKLKADRDMQRLGFTNATDDYYYPIRRGNIAKNVDTADIAGELDRVSNSSFNKDTVRGAKQELFIESADAVFNRHIHAVCQYAYLSPAVEAYNRLYNLDISGNKNKPISVATESANTWDRGNKYFVKLISDIQGIPATSGEGMKALGFIRGSYAKFQLGANPKVWLTQLSSVFASSSLLDADSITRGMAVSARGIDQYCSLAKLRNNDNTAAMAQGVLDSKAKRAVGAVSKFSDLLMSPIGKMDRFVVCRIFGACQVQVQKNGGAKVGTEANKVEAGKLLRRVILETQQNAIATERSAAMRSGNEIMRTLTMFTSDSMKVVGRVIDAVGEVSTLKAKLKETTDADARSALKQQLNVSNRKARKAVGALCLTAVFMASIAQLFRWLYDKEQDEDESVAETMLVDAVGNLFGGLPLFKDAYAKIFEGYDVDNYAYSALNDLLDSALNLFDVAGNILTNEGSTQERNRAMRNLAYSVGQLFGIPVRNVYNVFYGLTKRFDPKAAYVIDNAFYKKNYQNELYKAIEEDDAEMTSFIMSLLLGERMSEDVDDAVFNELLILSKNGQKVIPGSVPSKITIDEVEYPISAAEQAAIKDIYATSEKSLKALFAKSEYNTLSDEQKAAAIDFIYDTYYDKALEGALGIDRGNNSLIIADAVGVDDLALLYVTTKGLTSDIDRRGNVISGSKRKKVVAAINSLGVSTEKKLLLICAKGYSLQDNDIRGLSAENAKKRLLRYILNLKGATQTEKTELAKMCGFEVKNGRVVTKSVFSLG